ncbi:MCE family protein [Actinomadura sp. 6N118]|uniref:MCE family protein n=1 Tax=Actinomadura sp. 6N118 TaxID=3375151 RepID=UPI0037B692B2
MARVKPYETLRRRLLGVVFLLVPVLLVTLSVAFYQKRFTDVTFVTLRTSTAGFEMHRGADVKLHGVVIGEVRSITADGSGAQLRLALRPDQAKRVPQDVAAQLLPTTVFGARYVALVPPAGRGMNPQANVVAAALRDGSVISEDNTRNAIELRDLLKSTMRLLNALKPAQLSATLTAMAQALEGRGDRLGRNLVTLEAYLKELNPHLPALNQNLVEVAQFADNYSEVTPDILDGLSDFVSTSRTIADQRANLAASHESVTRAARDLTNFLRRNEDNLIQLPRVSRDSLETLARYSPEFPCTFASIAKFVPLMDKALGKGTKKPGVHVNINTVQHKGRYLPGVDRPRYTADAGPHCYGVPFDPGGGSTPKLTKPGVLPVGTLAGSPGETRLINELTAPALREAPEELPDWSGALLGPIYRGTRVTFPGMDTSGGKGAGQ